MPSLAEAIGRKVDVKSFRQFLRDLRDLAQQADRRLSSRLDRVVARVAASPFPATPDMLAFVQECRSAAEQLYEQAYANPRRYGRILIPDTPPDGTILADRAVEGPYGDRLRIKAITQDSQVVEGAAYVVPTYEEGDEALIEVEFTFLLSPTSPRLAENWRMFEQAVLHELIHCFDPKMRDPELALRFHPRYNPDVPYEERAIEHTAHQGQLRQRLETMKREGVAKPEAREWVRRYVHDLQRHAWGDYEYAVGTKFVDNPHLPEWRRLATVAYKLLDQVYG